MAMELPRYRTPQRRQRAICLALLALQAAYSFALMPAVPSLIGRDPVLLEALQGSTAAMVVGGAFAHAARASLALALLAPIPTLIMSGPLLWWAGRLWGPLAARYVAGRGRRARRRTDHAVKLVERYDSWAVVLAYVLPLPSALIYAAAGWTGMSLRRFLLLDLAGTFLWVALIVALGYAVGDGAINIAHTISHYGLVLTLALIPAALATLALRAVQHRRVAELQ
jgi:membrane protein DedA with SNARE-associated domain